MSVIAFDGLTKRFGDVAAVDDLTVHLAPRRVVGLLGPNGAGKTTTLRMLLGLVAPTAGSATIDGQPYRDLDEPIRHIGAVLEATSFHPGRRARELGQRGVGDQPSGDQHDDLVDGLGHFGE